VMSELPGLQRLMGKTAAATLCQVQGLALCPSPGRMMVPTWGHNRWFRWHTRDMFKACW
jgi:hypothetical protein